MYRNVTRSKHCFNGRGPATVSFWQAGRRWPLEQYICYLLQGLLISFLVLNEGTASSREKYSHLFTSQRCSTFVIYYSDYLYFCAVVQNNGISTHNLSSLKLYLGKDGLDWTLIMFDILQALDIIIRNRDLPIQNKPTNHCKDLIPSNSTSGASSCTLWEGIS